MIKCFLHISTDEQKARLTERLDDPTKHWKYNPGDVDERLQVGRLPAGVRDRARAVQHRARARGTSSRPTASGTATGRSPTLLLEHLQRARPAVARTADFDVDGREGVATESASAA